MQTHKISVKIASMHLSDAQKEEMWEVYKKYYSISKTSFMKRLLTYRQFNLELMEGKITGFTSICSTHTDIEDKPHAHNSLYTPEMA